MYFAKDKNEEFLVNLPNPNVLGTYMCPYRNCMQIYCSFAHSLVELKIWEFLNKNEISMQMLAAHQKNLKKNNLIKCIETENKQVFERNKVLHKIVNDGNINKLKELLKYSDGEILSDFNENNESILHVAVKNKSFELIKLFLEGQEFRKCLQSNQLSNCQYYSFINHKSVAGLTAFECLLLNNLNIQENLEPIFNLFLECDDCEVEKALEICKQKSFTDFERKLIERI